MLKLLTYIKSNTTAEHQVSDYSPTCTGHNNYISSVKLQEMI